MAESDLLAAGLLEERRARQRLELRLEREIEARQRLELRLLFEVVRLARHLEAWSLANGSTIAPKSANAVAGSLAGQLRSRILERLEREESTLRTILGPPSPDST